MNGPLLIFDGHAYAYRAYYAIKQLRSPAGEPTNAIYGFIKMVEKARQRLRPVEMAVIWDGGLAAERMALLPEYKAQRPPPPDGLDAQIDAIIEYLGAAGIASLQHSGVEADDWIAVVAREAGRRNRPVVIASSDKDFMQLVGPDIGLLNPNDKSEAVWTEAEVRAKTGVAPSQVVDWLSLIGDAVDNIPGVPGVGPKTAAALLAQFGSVDEIYRRLAEVGPVRLRGLLAAHEKAVRRNQKMVSLKLDLPGELSAGELSVKSADVERLRGLYNRWGFKSLARDLPDGKPAQNELFGES